jgi:conjugal transfer pilus assembly protein TraV
MRPLFLLVLPLALSGCLSPGTTSKSWSCRARGNESCAAISTIDQNIEPETKARPAIFGARPAAWWEGHPPTAETRSDAPRREGDQTMRIVVAPYVDAHGDYHERSEVFAVMRKAQWWIAPPIAVTSSPAPGTVVPAAPAASEIPIEAN